MIGMKGWSRRIAAAKNLIMAIIMIASFALLASLPPCALAQGTGWSTPQTIAFFDKQQDIHSGPSLAVDSSGDWHMVYTELDMPDSVYPFTTYIKYVNSVSGPYDIATVTQYSSNQGGTLFDPDIAIDSGGSIHVIYKHFRASDKSVSIEYTSANPSLFVVIPGINSHGEKMLERAEFMSRYDGADCLVRICETNHGQGCDLVNGNFDYYSKLEIS
jgi:hypothetical protein